MDIGFSDDANTARHVDIDETDLRRRLAQLTLAQKVDLLTGADFWSTKAEPSIGLRSMRMSDGPSGVRGAAWDERDPSLCLPSGTALAAAWDVKLATEYGYVLAREARRKGIDVVLGPTINLHRSPRSGRHFEAFSEDPTLTGDLAVAYIQGVQGQRIAAVPKHYVCNDSEDERFHVNVQVDDRPLHELYLAPFLAAVVRGQAWGVMSAYNSVNGHTMSENPLLEDPLCSVWGFDGVVVSDWTGVRTTVASARARQDIVMPGPIGPWGSALVAAVQDGRVREDAIDEKVLRLLRLAARVGALGESDAGRDPTPENDVDGVAFARKAAAAGMVLVHNRDELPWPAAQLRSIALIGEAATTPRIQGGGSAAVVPTEVVTPEHALRQVLPHTDITLSRGVAVTRGLVPFSIDQLTNPVTGAPGVRVRFLDSGGSELLTEDRAASHLVWTGGVPALATTLEVSTRLRPSHIGDLDIGVATIGKVEVLLDQRPLVSGRLSSLDDAMGTGLLDPPVLSSRTRLPTHDEVLLTFTNDLASRGHLKGAASLTIGAVTSAADDDQRIVEAADAAAAAQVAIVIVGTTNKDESEGSDRSTLTLPGRQDDLVRAVVAANPRTVVVVNTGSPVLMPWAEQAAAVLLVWFPGQQIGHALVDVLTGLTEPGGRLPTTWPSREEDVPVLSTAPTAGQLPYTEAIHIGYKAWLRTARKPAYAFGHGLGYTSFELGDAHIQQAADPAEAVRVTVPVRNTGTRAGKYVIQLYLSREISEVDRPARWLGAFDAVHLQPGQERTVSLSLGAGAFRHWADEGWQLEPGNFDVHVGAASDRTVHVGRLTFGDNIIETASR